MKESDLGRATPNVVLILPPISPSHLGKAVQGVGLFGKLPLRLTLYP